MNFVPLRQLTLDDLVQRLAVRIARTMTGSAGDTATRAEAGSAGQFVAGRESDFAHLIAEAAARHNVPEKLIAAVIQAESAFNPRATSSAGAKGLMQLMDSTARALGVRDPYQPDQNIDGGVRFLRSLLDRYESVPLALAAYNAGPGAVDHYGGIPPYAETQAYVKRIMGFLQREWEG